MGDVLIIDLHSLFTFVSKPQPQGVGIVGTMVAHGSVRSGLDVARRDIEGLGYTILPAVAYCQCRE